MTSTRRVQVTGMSGYVHQDLRPSGATSSSSYVPQELRPSGVTSLRSYVPPELRPFGGADLVGERGGVEEHEREHF